MSENIYPPCFYRVSVMALIYNEDKLLLIKEKDGRWSLPGGGLEVGETFENGIKREIKEELGVEVLMLNKQPKFVWTLIDESHKNQVPKLILTFEVQVDSFDFKNDARESVETGFFSKEEMKTLCLHPNSVFLLNRL